MADDLIFLCQLNEKEAKTGNKFLAGTMMEVGAEQLLRLLKDGKKIKVLLFKSKNGQAWNLNVAEDTYVKGEKPAARQSQPEPDLDEVPWTPETG